MTRNEAWKRVMDAVWQIVPVEDRHALLDVISEYGQAAALEAAEKQISSSSFSKAERVSA